MVERGERALDSKERQRLKIFEALVENSNDFIGIGDNEMNPIYLNPAGRKMLGIPLDKNIGEISIADCYPEDLRDFAANTILKSMLETGSWSGETYFRHFETNERIPVHDTHFEIKDPETGETLGHATITRDMSREKKLQEEVEREKLKAHEASKLATLGEMAAGVAHEINNPMAVMNGAIAVLKKKIDDPGLVRKIDLLESSWKRISRIVKGMKKLAHGSESMEKSFVTLNHVIKGCVDMVEEKSKRTGVEILCRDLSTERIYADEIQVEQALINLLNNSIDAVEGLTPSWVEVSTLEDEEFVSIVVKDSGHGVDSEILKSIFDPFYTSKPVGKGTGLGLPISKRIARDHGGDLEYKTIGGHTAFVLKVPVRSE